MPSRSRLFNGEAVDGPRAFVRLRRPPFAFGPGLFVERTPSLGRTRLPPGPPRAGSRSHAATATAPPPAFRAPRAPNPRLGFPAAPRHAASARIFFELFKRHSSRKRNTLIPHPPPLTPSLTIRITKRIGYLVYVLIIPKLLRDSLYKFASRCLILENTFYFLRT